MTITTATAKPAARTFRFLERFAGNTASIRVTQIREKREEVTDYDVTLTPVGGVFRTIRTDCQNCRKAIAWNYLKFYPKFV